MRLRTAAAIFLPLAVLATCLCGLVYVVVQQDLRTGANEPQQQLVEDAAAQLNGGADPSSVVSGPTVDLGVSLAPFVVVYDPSGTVLATNGELDGQPPMIPTGALESAHASGIDKVTWQPQPGVRIATVSVPWSGGTASAGRSLRVVEEQESALELLVAGDWLATLVSIAWRRPWRPGSSAGVRPVTANRRKVPAEEAGLLVRGRFLLGQDTTHCRL